MLDGSYYSERERNLLKGTLRSLTDQIFEFISQKHEKKKRHNRVATVASVASSKFSLSVKSVKTGLSKAFSIRRVNTKLNYTDLKPGTGSPAASITSIRNPTPVRKRFMNFPKMFIKQNSNLENLQNNYTQISTKIVDHLASRIAEVKPNYNSDRKELLSQGLLLML